jgi:hypothetical protein
VEARVNLPEQELDDVAEVFAGRPRQDLRRDLVVVPARAKQGLLLASSTAVCARSF